MHTKFKRDDYGIRLALTPNSSDERLLLDEMLERYDGRAKFRNLRVEEIDGEIVIDRPRMINDIDLKKRGFVIDKDYPFIRYKLIGETVMILFHSGVRYVYLVACPGIMEGIGLGNVHVESSEFAFTYTHKDGYDVTVTIQIKQVPEYLGNIQTIRELDKILDTI